MGGVKMRVCVLSANLGGFDEPVHHVPQVGVEVAYHAFTDANFPPRPKSLTLRLQSKIPKMFGWDLVPGYDAYLWLDASLELSKPDSVAWFIEQLGDADIVVFKHPSRDSIHEEADFLRHKIHVGNRYILGRYLGEDLDGQMREVEKHTSYVDDHLFAAGAFCYRPTFAVQDAMRDWWVHTSRFHVIDQLAFPFVLHGCDVRVIDEDIYRASRLRFARIHGHG